MLPSAMGVGLVSRIKIMAGMNIVERRRPQDGQLTAQIDGKDTDVRVATAATIWGEKCVMRILDKNRSVLRLHDLGMPDDTHETFSRLVKAPFGMVLCAGPTGSGKTTTLYATLGEVSRSDQERHDDRGPGRVRLPVDQPDPDQRAGGPDLRHGAEVDPAPGPRRHPGRRDPRRRNGADRRAVRPDRPPGPVVPARHRLGLGAPPLLGHGDRVVPDRLIGARHRRPAPGPTHLPVVQDLVHAHRRGDDLLRGERRRAEDGLLPRHRLQLLRPDRLPGPDRRLRAPADDARDQASHRRLGDPGRTAAPGPEARACAHSAKRRSTSSRKTSRRSPKSSEASTHSRRGDGQKPWKSTGTAQSTTAGKKVSGVETRPVAGRGAHRAARARLPDDRGLGEEERPPVRGHQEDGAAQGHHALLAAALPCSCGPASRSWRRSRSSPTRRPTSCSRASSTT